MVNRSIKKALGLRLSEDAIALLREMAQRNGLSQAGIMELAIREKAAREGVTANSTASTHPMKTL